jgi:tetratricopeptide (TPR) repeat protein
MASDALARDSRDSAAPSLEPGAEIISGRYRVEAPLGEGGMASVWRVHDNETGQKLALKYITTATNPKLLALFEREFQTLASLRHPSIVQAYDYGSDGFGPYYTMELLAGSDVSTLAPLPWPHVCRILRDVASGIALLHARKLLHRDLSARNVRSTPDGQVKLIDFGTMASFGRLDDVVGTPPFVAPEALRGRELDQRTDLYSLGALAYFLLSGRHAFPARTLSALEAAWNDPPKSVQHRVSELGRADLPEVPATLERLIESLLNHDMLARPKSAADLIDRLTVIASLEREKPLRMLASYLKDPTYVGRASQRHALRTAFADVSAGSARTLLVEANAGLGRTRLLSELALEARLSGATVLQAETGADLATHGVALQLALRLLSALPTEARAAAKPYAATLAHLSPTLRARLGIAARDLADLPQTHGEARMRVQAALCAWFLAVAKEHVLVVVADDLHNFDEGSAAWLAALAHEAKTNKLLIVGSLRHDAVALSAPVQVLRQHAVRLSLPPLTDEEMLALFRSVFGDVPYLARLVDRLQQRAEGSPGTAIDLAEHLSRDGAIAYADGAWLLPSDLDEHSLPASRQDAELARLARLSEDARQLGQMLAIREGSLSQGMCEEIADMHGATLQGALAALIKGNVLMRTSEGYRFTRDSLRQALHAQLDSERRKSAHRRLGKLLLESGELSALDRLKAGVHLLLGGDDEEGSRVVALSAQHYGLVDLADLAPAVPSLELALAHFRATNRSPYEQASLLAPLALAGYYADKRLATRYGPETVSLLARLVGLGRARILQRFLGKKLGLLLALISAMIAFGLRRNNPRVPKFRDTIMMLFNCVAALAGASVICFDYESARRYTRVLEPMTALGPNHVASFMQEFSTNLVGMIREHPAATRSRWIHLVEKLDRPQAEKDLGDVHVLYLAGALYARGVGEARRDQTAALEMAERLSSFGLKLYDMSADQVRTIYYAHRGDLDAYELYSQKVEVHAIQRGTAWQVEAWKYSGMMGVHLRTGDVGGMKDCVEQLKRFSADMPSLQQEYKRALAAYLVLRGTPQEGLDVMEANPERPGEIICWGRCEGVRARAYNDLGRHAEARAVCLFALEYLTDEDLAFSGHYQNIAIELARAEAALGDYQSAETRLRELIDEYTPWENPLSLGSFHEVLAEIARTRGNHDGFLAALREMERWFRATRHPALVARCERLVKLVASQTVALSKPPDDPRQVVTLPQMTVLDKLREGRDTSTAGSAEWTLRQLTGHKILREAYLFVQADDGHVSCVAEVRGEPNLGVLTSWVQAQLSALRAEALTCTVGLVDDEPSASTSFVAGAQTYRLIVLRVGADNEGVAGALVVPEEVDLPEMIIREIAVRMQTSFSLHTVH